MTAPLPDDLIGLLALVRVVQLGSFTAAATALGISKSVVSERIARLEDRLGVQVLQRTTRRLSLTGAGERIFERAQRLVAEAEATMETSSTAISGVLKLTAPSSFGASHLTPALSQFLLSYPQVTLQLSLTERFVDIVGDGIDLALRITSRLRDSGLVVRRLGSVRMAICASPQYLIRAGTPKTPDDFLLHSCLHYTLVPINIEWGFDEQLLSPRFSTDSGHALKEAVIAGLGLAVMPRFLIEQELLDGSLAEVMSGSHMLLW